ncbi:MAG TPA: histidine kinase dimerization/phosphoacceptor domain -containing protein [Azospirillum sp.]|nr:histidine kinase dimerization/phosphoacceptor domain -containing protein [Azospirillum sp.]
MKAGFGAIGGTPYANIGRSDGSSPIKPSAHVRNFALWPLSLSSMPLMVQCVGATAVVAVFMVMGLVFQNATGTVSLFVIAPAALLSAFLFEWRAALYSIALCALCSIFLFIEPINSLQLANADDLAKLIAFLFAGSLAVLLFDELKKTLAELQSRKDDLRAAFQRLEASDAEKDVLLRELTHRVKNDLQMVASLLQLQSRGCDADTQATLLTASQRIMVLGRIHTRLTRSREHDTAVNMREFLEELCHDLHASLVGDDRIGVRLEVEDTACALLIPLSRAVPVGLIVNELLTNALKYAFPNGRDGRIVVRLGCTGDTCRLEIRDDGIGLQGKSPKSTSLGMRLVTALVDQIGGDLQTSTDGGVTHTIHFPRTP